MKFEEPYNKLLPLAHSYDKILMAVILMKKFLWLKILIATLHNNNYSFGDGLGS